MEKKNIVKVKNIKRTCLGFINKAEESNKISINYLKEKRWDYSIKNGVDCIEFCLKCILVNLIGEYPKVHDFRNHEEFKRLLEEASNFLEKCYDRDENMPYIPLGRLLVVAGMWSKSYIDSKYGIDEDCNTSHLYKKDEANLILKHCEECLYWCTTLYDSTIGL